jgi:hypothetical protein
VPGPDWRVHALLRSGQQFAQDGMKASRSLVMRSLPDFWLERVSFG